MQYRLLQALVRYRSDHFRDSVFDRNRSKLATECDRILAKCTLVGRHRHLVRIQFGDETRASSTLC
ncbi:hypothetical protein C490_07426 [Natronobacterium gregoryi SP2]|uniref:Uncharacterized protein n=1 Tax=Natronobacterium gregoryi (strain ATCC 43098 / DSM 3393 / CCM 3738 / CIP 104747 / IAM 13177 / JCM 8860 / NBRC 102187 / NCIMB 2189 / SP2) TaxID=797304 RepID=L9Y9U0_NATGS|nr:hypothetical protein C490_07426 [Natronobacterium gregoryi SP2]